MADLLPRSVQVDDLLLGPGTPYSITKILGGGKPDADVGDRPRPREDGSVFGRDRLQGRLLSLEATIDTDSYLAAQAAWAELSVVWDAKRVRDMPGAVMALRVRQFDGATRVVFGRPGRITPADEELLNLGRLDVVMDFRCIDNKCYADVETTNAISIIPPSSGGLRSPLTDPLTTFGRGEGVGVLEVGGDVEAWLVSLITGPITGPVVDVPLLWKASLDYQLYATENILIDPQPWSRSVRKNGFANMRGKLTPDSPYLSEMLILPGAHEVLLRGIDPTGTASLVTTHRDAFLTL